MADMVNTVIGILIWEFVTAILLIMSNTIVGGYVAPIMKDIANNTPGVDGAAYAQQVTPIENGFVIALYIIAALPFIYLFVRMLLKREQTSPPSPYYIPGGGVG